MMLILQVMDFYILNRVNNSNYSTINSGDLVAARAKTVAAGQARQQTGEWRSDRARFGGRQGLGVSRGLRRILVHSPVQGIRLSLLILTDGGGHGKLLSSKTGDPSIGLMIHEAEGNGVALCGL